MVNHPNRSKLSSTAKMLLADLLRKGGAANWWPNNKEAAALRALENRGFVIYGETWDHENKGGGLFYKLTEEGRIAAKLVSHPKT